MMLQGKTEHFPKCAMLIDALISGTGIDGMATYYDRATHDTIHRSLINE